MYWCQSKRPTFNLDQNKKTPVQLMLKYHQILDDENYVHIYLDDKALLELDQIKEGVLQLRLSITDKSGVHRLGHQKDLLTEDMWGAHLTFSLKGDKKKKLLQDTENIILTVGPAQRPNDRLNNQTARSYTFVPGKVDW